MITVWSRIAMSKQFADEILTCHNNKTNNIVNLEMLGEKLCLGSINCQSK